MPAIATEDARKFVRSQLETIAHSRNPGESVGAMLLRVSRTAGIGFSKVRRYWYGEVDNIPWHEAETLRLRAAEEVKQRWELMKARQELAELQTELRRAEDNDAEGARRYAALSSASSSNQDRAQVPQLHFWLGSAAADLDRKGDA